MGVAASEPRRIRGNVVRPNELVTAAEVGAERRVLWCNGPIDSPLQRYVFVSDRSLLTSNNNSNNDENTSADPVGSFHGMRNSTD